MKHRPVRLTTAAFLSFCVLLAWGKTSAAGINAATTDLARRRSLRGASFDETNAYHDHEQPLPGVPDQHQQHRRRALRPNSPIDQPVSAWVRWACCTHNRTNDSFVLFYTTTTPHH